VQWDALEALVAEASERMDPRLIARRVTDDFLHRGQVICACFGVELETIRALVAQRKANNVNEIGKLLGAGTNCGSCLPELRRIVSREHTTQPV
jgi:assimilatory nitrate reductase catalytic subunit